MYIKFISAIPKTHPPSMEFFNVRVDSMVERSGVADERLGAGGVGNDSKKIAEKAEAIPGFEAPTPAPMQARLFRQGIPNDS
jgi:hypothetical protein